MDIENENVNLEKDAQETDETHSTFLRASLVATFFLFRGQMVFHMKMNN